MTIATLLSFIPGATLDIVLLPRLRRLPRRVDRIAAAAEGGRLSVNVRVLADEQDRASLAR